MGYAQEQERPRLLFVDDEQRVLNSMRIMFRREFDLYLAASGAEALKIVRDNEIDVIVADHRMPKMTGVQVLSRVREMSPRTVRILLTGYADLDAVEGSINEGEVFRFLTKPCPPAQLRETVALAAQLARHTGAVEDPAEPLAAEEVDFLLDSDEPVNAAKRAAALPQQPGPPPDQAPARAPGNAGASAQSAPQSPPAARPSRPTMPSATPAHGAATARNRAVGADDAPAASDTDASATSFDPAATGVLEKPPILAAGPRLPVDGHGAAASPALARGLGIIVFSEDEAVVSTVQRAVRGRIPVYATTNIVQVVKCLTERQPGVLITDVSDDKTTIQAMTARLKEHLPELVTIAVSEHRDVLDMVWLINHGQIFRFLRKPLSPGRCAISLQAALKHHRMLLKNPELTKRHVVDASDSNNVVEGMLSKLKLVRRLWASA